MAKKEDLSDIQFTVEVDEKAEKGNALRALALLLVQIKNREKTKASAKNGSEQNENQGRG